MSEIEVPMRKGKAWTISSSESEPWQLQMMRRSLKKQLKLSALLEVLGEVNDLKCLLLTCGDNNGALNWHFRANGGQWTWGEFSDENLTEIGEFLGEPVESYLVDSFPVDDEQFDCVIAIDVLEHVDDDQRVLKEIRRVLRPGGRAIITVPNGDPKLLANRVRWRLGMTPEVYGHTRAGFTAAELSERLQLSGLIPRSHSGYSAFFTEVIELFINFGYVFVLRKGKVDAGKIAPTSAKELRSHGLAYRMYSLLFPLIKQLSRLDNLFKAEGNYAVIVSAVKSTNSQ
jgi:SAM-dependent methyltransferase